MNDTSKLNLYTLSLVRMVAKHRGFTAASKEAGISQSALTRQIQSLESQIGVQLFERTTRSVSLTEAGAVLLRETEPLPNILSGALRRVREEFLDAPREIRVGISSSLSQAHIPGIFHAHQQSSTKVPVIVSQLRDDDVIKQVAMSYLDIGIVSIAEKLPESVTTTHEMTDEFCAVTSANADTPFHAKEFKTWAKDQNWLLPPGNSPARTLIKKWSRIHNIPLPCGMEMENFDLMNQFAALGMGCAMVPQRSVSGIPRKHRIQKVKLPHLLVRNLSVICPRHGTTPEHVRKFVRGILFS